MSLGVVGRKMLPLHTCYLFYFFLNTKHGWKLTSHLLLEPTKFALPRCGSWKFCSKHALFKLTLGRIRAVYLILTQPISRASCLPAQHGPELLPFPFSRHDALHDNVVWWANQPFFCSTKLFARRCYHWLSCVVILWRPSSCWWRALLHPPHIISLPLLLIICI